MRSSDSLRGWLLPATAALAALLIAGCSGGTPGGAQTSAGASSATPPKSATADNAKVPSSVTGARAPACAGDAGLTLPAGFCGDIFADDIGHARHMAVAANGVLYVNTWSGRYYPNSPPPPGGFLVALQDTTGSGKANVIERFGATVQSGGHGGTGIALYGGYLYAELNDRIVRYAMSPDSIVPKGSEEVVVSGLPLTGDHPMHPFAIDADGWLYVDLATPTNSCQRRNRMLESPGIDPCSQLKTRGGIWRYSAHRLNQKFSPDARYATGIRNADGIAIDSTGHGLYATQHGRDQLGQNWPKLFTPEQGAILPAEELLHVAPGGDYGWPYCYYDGIQQKLVLAPEYGGDGKRVAGCAGKLGPIAAFPAHWAPNDVTLYYGKQFPAQYYGGAFIAFHGSWNRAPFPQQGYNVVFQPLAGGEASGGCEIFADGFAGAQKGPGSAEHRPSGVAVGPDGALYVSDDVRGRIYRIVYRGAAGSAADSPAGSATASPAASGPAAAGIAPCPSMSALEGSTPTAGAAVPPEGNNPNAGAAASANAGANSATNAGANGGAAADLPVPRGATRAMVELGGRIYHGEVASATCAGCHGTDGRGTPLGPDLTSNKWLWSRGSYAGIARSIRDGVAQPKAYRSPMPPMGGAQLSPRQVSAVAAYVWALSHRDGR